MPGLLPSRSRLRALEGGLVTYQVKEIFYTLQGEGANAGRPAVFCRFAGCNLWSGREQDRAMATCRFCDTDFVGVDGTGGGKFRTAHELADAVASYWPGASGEGRLVVLTGGEPLLQVDEGLVTQLHARNFRIAVETNGTLQPPTGLDWICVSPKAGSDWVLKAGHELKLVWPQPGFDLDQLRRLAFEHFFLQPMDGPQQTENTRQCIEQCMRMPPWRLGVQMHKILGVR